MTNANIIIPVDLQNGFARTDLTHTQGGCLYVPDGERASAPMADLILLAEDKIIILTQDFHPADHISFMENHKAILALRREQVKAAGGNPDDPEAVLAPPFTNILVEKRNHHFEPVAVDIGGSWKKVETNFDSRIVHILDEVVDANDHPGSFGQTLWRQHCVQGSTSALFTPEIMAVLPDTLVAQLQADTTSPILQSRDERGNTFFVVRKGMNVNLDSYGIATENDGISQTSAPQLFAQLAAALTQQGVTHADIDIGGLATNFCVEFSQNDVRNSFVKALATQGITARVYHLSDVSRGIPLSIPGGIWPDLDGTQARMAARGTLTRTTDDVARAGLRGHYGTRLRPLAFTPA